MSNAVAPRLLEARAEDPDEVWGWYQFQRQILGEEATRALTVLGSSAPHSSPELGRYVGQTANDLKALFAEQGDELDLLTMLGMIAATEGRLQRDFFSRVDQRLKDGVSREFQKAKKRRDKRLQRVDLDEDILDIWRANGPQPVAKKTVAHFKAVLNLRHWLAHGRYWVARLGRDYDVQDVYVICINILQALDI